MVIVWFAYNFKQWTSRVDNLNSLTFKPALPYVYKWIGLNIGDRAYISYLGFRKYRVNGDWWLSVSWSDDLKSE